MSFIQKRPIILASGSPRRRQLMQEAGYTFEVRTFDVDESFPPEMMPEMVAPMLAQRKARAAAHLIVDKEIVLAADSTVILDNTIFNKPADYEEAVFMLKALSGKKHTVVTGICLLSAEGEVVKSAHTQVWFEPLSTAEIEYYIETCQPFDKAGAYGAQDWIGHCKISRIEGTFQNVMGLPVYLVYQELLQLNR